MWADDLMLHARADDVSLQARALVRQVNRLVEKLEAYRAAPSQEAVAPMAQCIEMVQAERRAIREAVRRARALIPHHEIAATRVAHQSWPTFADPPKGACYILDLLLPRDEQRAVPGDLVEEFEEKLAEYGPIGARIWFWREAIEAIVRRNPVFRWLLVYGLGRLADWIFGKINS